MRPTTFLFALLAAVVAASPRRQHRHWGHPHGEHPHRQPITSIPKATRTTTRTITTGTVTASTVTTITSTSLPVITSCAIPPIPVRKRDNYQRTPHACWTTSTVYAHHTTIVWRTSTVTKTVPATTTTTTSTVTSTATTNVLDTFVGPFYIQGPGAGLGFRLSSAPTSDGNFALVGLTPPEDGTEFTLLAGALTGTTVISPSGRSEDPTLQQLYTDQSYAATLDYQPDYLFGFTAANVPANGSATALSCTISQNPDGSCPLSCTGDGNQFFYCNGYDYASFGSGTTCPTGDGTYIPFTAYAVSDVTGEI
ncbi:hypothetical protein BDY17DRAFT_330844 [Neohortaea acidophila]|uniref:Thaumatin n=1 Tax=Neohortaea acidophila TaxID=245834 RepID=A0A6A6PGQ3_9PEZI|nr:uncharacterized protein BDY17DRAFT_330844 [Neohortaea acidophila]KAF2479162.1 hypothetical protein BDY17DRAFT_330844 [Neohortaea acidophila]